MKSGRLEWSPVHRSEKFWHENAARLNEKNFELLKSVAHSVCITHPRPFKGPLSWTTRVSRYQKGKTNLDFTKQETVSGSRISWDICKSATRTRQITTPAPHHSFFSVRMPFLPPNQQRQSTEGTISPHQLLATITDE